MLYAKQNDLLEQSCQIDAEHTTLDGKIRTNELEFGKINQLPDSFTQYNLRVHGARRSESDDVGRKDGEVTRRGCNA